MLQLFALTLLASPYVLQSAGAEPRAPRETVIPVKPEEPNGYAGNPSTIHAPMRQDLKALALTPRGGGKFGLSLGSGEAAAKLDSIDLAEWMPRVPRLAKGDAVLTRLALIQREFNRNEIRLGPVHGADDLRIANNCLKRGLWEAMLVTKEGDQQLLGYHGWFEIPGDLYGELFTQLNGIPYAEWSKSLEQYPDLNGFVVPLAKLRAVTDERALELSSHADQPVLQLSEQKRKAKLLLSTNIQRYADFAASGNQPIQTAVFAEPGWYDTAHPMKFDLTWLAKPTGAIVRRVRGVAQPVEFSELELQFGEGRRILIGDQALAKLAPRAGLPAAEADVLRLTFGIGTPDIYASEAERRAELAEDRASYLLMLDRGDRNIDNHLAGVDRAYLWRDSASPSRLHVHLVGYERIALVAHFSIAWPE